MKDQIPAIWYNANGHERGPIGELRPALPPSDSLLLPTEEIGGTPSWAAVVIALGAAAIVAALAVFVLTYRPTMGGPAGPGSPASTYGPPGAESTVVGSTP